MGVAHVRRFVAEGAEVVFGDVLEAECEALAKELGDAADVAPLDVTLEDHWAGAVVYVKRARKLGGLHVLVNNAGIGAGTPIVGRPARRLHARAIMINQVGVWLGMQHGRLPRCGEPGAGSIVNISSIDGLIGMVDAGGYVSAKFAVPGMTHAAAIELGSPGIRMNSVHPGFVETPMLRRRGPGGARPDRRHRRAADSAGRFARPDDVTATVVFLASDASSYFNGAQLVVDGGQLAGPNQFGS